MTKSKTPAATIEVALSDRAPVKIDANLWPKIVEVSDHDGQLECQANTGWYLIVREHRTDGRRLVYGAKERGNGGQVAGFRAVHEGYLIERPNVEQKVTVHATYRLMDETIEKETVRAIRRVAGAIGADQLGSVAIGALPAREI